MPRRSTFNLEFIIKPPSWWSGTERGDILRARPIAAEGRLPRPQHRLFHDWLVRTLNSPTHRGRSPPRSKRQSQGIGRVHRPIEQRLKKPAPPTPSVRDARSTVLRVAPKSSDLQHSGGIPAGSGHSGRASTHNGSRPSANVPAPKPSVHRVAAGQLPRAAVGLARTWAAAAVERSRCLSQPRRQPHRQEATSSTISPKQTQRCHPNP
jgi:hypothetical protein